MTLAGLKSRLNGLWKDDPDRPPKFVVFADAAFALTDTSVTPYRCAQTSEELAFNHDLSSGRISVEQLFGVLKKNVRGIRNLGIES